jgi:hypothetical protein
VALAEGDAATAIDELYRALRDGAERGEALATVERAEELASALALAARPQPAATLVGATSAARERLGTPRTPAREQRTEALLASVQATLGRDGCDEAVAAGARREVTDVARELVG